MDNNSVEVKNSVTDFPTAEEVIEKESERVNRIMNMELFSIKEKINKTGDERELSLDYKVSKATAEFLASKHFRIKISDDGKSGKTMVTWGDVLDKE